MLYFGKDSSNTIWLCDRSVGCHGLKISS